MKTNLLTAFAILILFTSIKTMAQKPEHQIWDQLLKEYVSPEGKVNYTGFKNDPRFTKYLNQLKNNTPTTQWSRSEKMAYWINVYNAFTIKLITAHYPVSSIRDIPAPGDNPWKKSFIKLGTQSYTLDEVEHDILRKKYFDPRIHFVVNCAALSCPRLQRKAITADNLNTVMEQATRNFINHPKHNKLGKQQVQISKIFDWFKEDFTKNGTLIDYLNRYSQQKINPDAQINYMHYNWNLNNQ